MVFTFSYLESWTTSRIFSHSAICASAIDNDMLSFNCANTAGLCMTSVQHSLQMCLSDQLPVCPEPLFTCPTLDKL